MAVGPILCPALVGRADELHELTRRRLSASKGHGGLVLVTGDGGIGKSRLISAFREELAGRRTGFGIGYCRPTGNAPYAPFREAARGIGSALDVTALNRDERLALLADAVAGACRRRNAVLVIEDAHWADTGSLNLISHLLPSLRSLPLLLVVTYRTDLTLDAQAAPYFARFQRHCAAEIALGPLSPSDMRLLLRLAIAKSHRVRAQQLDEVIARAEGNPFFAEELLKSLLMRDHARRTNTLPPTIRAVVEERLHELGEPYVRIAMCASVLGRSIDPSLLAQLSEPSDGDVLVALGRMRDLQIVEQPAVAGMRKATARRIQASHALGRIPELYAQFNLAFWLCALGFDRKALDIFQIILPDLRAGHLSSLLMLAYANAALIHCRRGDLEQARELIALGLAVPLPSTTGPVALATAALTLADLTNDEALLEKILTEEVADAAFRSHIDSTLGRFAGPYARWFYSNNRRDEARAALRRAIGLLHGPFASTETLLAAVELGDEPTAQRAMTLAAHMHAKTQIPLYVATAAHLRAIAADRIGGKAHGYALEAARSYEDLGWPAHARSCLELCEQHHAAKARRTVPVTGTLRRVIALSPREAEIADLVARGLSNKNVATMLNVSLRTVEKHLTTIYDKLGLRNRAELVARIARSGRL